MLTILLLSSAQLLTVYCLHIYCLLIYVTLNHLIIVARTRARAFVNKITKSIEREKEGQRTRKERGKRDIETHSLR